MQLHGATAAAPASAADPDVTSAEDFANRLQRLGLLC
jgi:hypothetical protein